MHLQTTIRKLRGFAKPIHRSASKLSRYFPYNGPIMSEVYQIVNQTLPELSVLSNPNITRITAGFHNYEYIWVYQ